MLGEGIVGHILGDEQPLVAIAAVTNQIGKPPMPQLAHTPRFISELFGIGPGLLGEFLDSDPATALEAALVDDVGRFLAALGDDEICAEVVGGGFEVDERVLGEGRHAASAAASDGVPSRRGGGVGAVRRVGVAHRRAVVVLARVRPPQKRRFATTHDSDALAHSRLSEES